MPLVHAPTDADAWSRFWARKEGFLPAEYTTRVRDQRQPFLYIFARRRVGYAGDATHAMPANRCARLIKRRSRKMGLYSDPHFRDTGTETDWDSKNCAPSHSHTRAAGRRDHPPTTHHTTPAPYFTLNPQIKRERHVPRNAPVLTFCGPALGPRPPAPIRVPYVRVPAGCMRVGGHVAPIASERSNWKTAIRRSLPIQHPNRQESKPPTGSTAGP